MKVMLVVVVALIACGTATFFAIDNAPREEPPHPQRIAGVSSERAPDSGTQNTETLSLGARTQPDVGAAAESVEAQLEKGDGAHPANKPVDWREPFEIKYAGWSADEIRARRDELARLHNDRVRDVARVQLEAGNFIEVLGTGMPEAHLIPSPPPGQGTYKLGFEGPDSEMGATTRWVVLFTQDIPPDVLEIGRESGFVNQRAQDMGIPRK